MRVFPWGFVFGVDWGRRCKLHLRFALPRAAGKHQVVVSLAVFAARHRHLQLASLCWARQCSSVALVQGGSTAILYHFWPLAVGLLYILFGGEDDIATKIPMNSYHTCAGTTKSTIYS